MLIFQLYPFRSTVLSKEFITLDAWSRTLPTGWYTTFRTFESGRCALGLHWHLQRILLPAQQHHLPIDFTADTLRRRIADCLAGQQGDWRIRLVLTSPPAQLELWMAIEPLQLPSPEIYQTGVKVMLTQLSRENPTEKSTAFIETSANVRQTLVQRGIYEGLMVQHNRILEGLTSNFYVIQNDILYTTKYGILSGVTRRIVLTLARQSRLPIVYRAPRINQIAQFSEAFLSSSSRGIVPIVQIDETCIADGIPGTWTTHLMHAYTAYLQTHTQPIAPQHR